MGIFDKLFNNSNNRKSSDQFDTRKTNQNDFLQEFTKQQVFKNKPIDLAIDEIQENAFSRNSSDLKKAINRAIETLKLDCTSDQELRLNELLFDCYQELGKNREALQSLNIAIDLCVNQTGIYNHVSRHISLIESKIDILTLLDEFDDALNVCSELFDIYSGNDKYKVSMIPDLYGKIAAIYVRQKKYSLALKEINKVFLLFEENSSLYYAQYNSLITRARIKKAMGDENGYSEDMNLYSEWMNA